MGAIGPHGLAVPAIGEGVPLAAHGGSRKGDEMFESLKARWNAAKQQRFEERAAKYLKMHFGEVLGSDERILDQPNAIDSLHRKYYGGA